MLPTLFLMVAISEKQKREERFSLKIRLNLKEEEQQSKLNTKLSSLIVLPTFFTEHLDIYEKKKLRNNKYGIPHCQQYTYGTEGRKSNWNTQLPTAM